MAWFSLNQSRLSFWRVGMERQKYGDDCSTLTLSVRTPQAHYAIVLRNDALRDPEPKSIALLRFCSEERLQNSLSIFLRDPHSPNQRWSDEHLFGGYGAGSNQMTHARKQSKRRHPAWLPVNCAADCLSPAEAHRESQAALCCEFVVSIQHAVPNLRGFRRHDCSMEST